MASTFTKVSLLRSGAVRAYSAQVAPVAGSTNYEVKTSVLPNKLVVAHAENDSPISRVSILFRAGSRNESGESMGATHVLRVAAGGTTQSFSKFAIARQVAQAGAILTCTTDRELVAYTLEGTRKAVQDTIPILSAVAAEQLFYPWEISENDNRLRLELATRPPQLRAVDLLHKAAYRTGLGNSLYTAKYNIGKVSSETLQHYTATNFTSNRAAVVGIGISHDKLLECAQNLPLDSGSDETGPGVYKGGEIRYGGDLAYVAIAGEGGSLKNIKEAIAFSVLQQVYGMGPSTKRGLGSSNLLRKAIGELNEPHSIAAINVCYSDSGLFGVLLTGSANIAGNLVAAALKTLKSPNISDADVNRGKNQLKTTVLSAMESGSYALEKIGLQAVLTGTVLSPSEIASMIDTVSAAEVKAAAQKVASSKPTITGVGNLRCVPFLDELK
ncbi:metalloprotease [Holotrichia oblita]|uniref:Metalloprotease n=1 Tax=Holotrichia oblita TaxID=644536 RepID=A0ACB9TWH8_HOLOL|nr:metalloprotease [Holotrichia oblita]